MNLREQLIAEEGNIPYAYQDHLGFWTIGVGILIDKRKGGHLRPEEINFILDNRIALKGAEVDKALPWAKALNEPRRAVLIGMAFQMGLDGLLDFTNTLKLIQAGKYAEAGKNMMLSLWAKQTPGRAQRMADQMKTGEWQRKK